MSGRSLILVTRPAGTADGLVAELEAGGWRVAAVPTVAVEPVPAGGPLDEALADAHGWDWIVVASAAGAIAVAAALERGNDGRTALAGVSDSRTERNGDTKGPARPRFAAVGPATASALESAGYHVDLIPATSSGRGLADALTASAGGRLNGARILLARADAAAGDLPTALREAGAEVRDVVAYRTVEAPGASAAPLTTALSDPDLAAVVVASGSAARGFLTLADGQGLAARALSVPVISIGPSTSAVLDHLRFQAVIQAASPTTAALVAAAEPLRDLNPELALSGRHR